MRSVHDGGCDRDLMVEDGPDIPLTRPQSNPIPRRKARMIRKGADRPTDGRAYLLSLGCPAPDERYPAAEGRSTGPFI